jgi:hypothetical protein
MKRLLLGLALFLAILPRLHADEATVQRVLIPLSFGGSIPGGYGSLWVVEFRGRNDGDTPVRFEGGDPFAGCIIPECPRFIVPAHTSFIYTPSIILPGSAIPGELRYLPRAMSSQLTFNVRIRDLSRALSTWGTEIPVIRDSAALTGVANLLAIPTDDRFRATLRAYDLFPTPGGDTTVRIRVYSMTDDALLGESILTLHIGSPTEFPHRPGFGLVTNLLEQFPGAAGKGLVRIEVQPLTAGLRYWAFVSVTNNDTQHVTTITPQ